MRPVYFLLWIILPYVLAVFYRRRKAVNTQPDFYAQTIFVCNHPSAFIDPLIIANFHRPIIHFMTRSDVFKPWLKPVTWACHMVPIYRLAEDGNESTEKNIGSFKAAIEVLKNRKSLIMFSEGYTDDVFIRSLKPIKKGPARIALGAMVSTNWTQDIKIQAIGVNYTDPGRFNCDLVVKGGKVIHLKDYKEIFDQNPNRAATLITREMEKELQEQITYVKDKSLAPFVDHVQAILRNGMHHDYTNKNIPLKERQVNSQRTANHVNANFKSDDENWSGLKKDLEAYFNEQKREGISENWVYDFSQGKGKNLIVRFLSALLLLPVFLIGFVHLFLPYIVVKTTVEKIFRRRVFWSGVKLLLGALLATLFNLPVIWLFHDFIYESYWLGVLYFLTVPAISGVIAYNYALRFADTLRILKIPAQKILALVAKRDALTAKIKSLGF